MDGVFVHVKNRTDERDDACHRGVASCWSDDRRGGGVHVGAGVDLSGIDMSSFDQ